VANNIEKIDRNSFHIISLIGAGGFSKVWEVKWKKNGKLFAMKEMSKARIIDRKSVKSILAEREILSKMNHPFIINLHFSFQDSNKLYLIMDLAKGQDLRQKIGYSNTNQMNEEQTKFIAGCVILGLEYMHYNQIVHRDIKPENIIMDENGYAKITDFGLSTHLSKLSTKESPGTFSYMAPEIIFHEKTNISLDYYSLGIIVYELMKGIRPYVEFSAKETKDYLLANQFSMKRYAVPEGWGIESADFINRLLLKNPKERLGASGTKELKNHCWFRGFNFKDLYKFKIKSPIIVENKKDEVKIKTIDKETYKRYNKIMKSHEYKTAFKSFLYFNLYDQNLSKDFFSNPHEETTNNNKKIINNNNGENNSFNLYVNNDESISLPKKNNISFTNYYMVNNQEKLI
jgi:serine/threonine protein kinase